MSVWFAPNVAAPDLMKLFEQPALWEVSRKLIDVLMLTQWQITHAENPQAGPNTAPAFIARNAFAWLNAQGIDIAIEAGALKEYECVNGGAADIVALKETLSIIYGSNAYVSYVEMDEPFVSMLPVPPEGCGWSMEATALGVKKFIDAIHEDYPGIKIGLVEAYPAHSFKTLVEIVAALISVGVELPFFHLDIDYYRVKREHAEKQLLNDLRQFEYILHSNGVRFGATVWGQRGTSNKEFAEDSLALAEAIHKAIGFLEQDDIVFQSWSEDRVGRKRCPDVLPETGLDTHTALLLELMDKWR